MKTIQLDVFTFDQLTLDAQKAALQNVRVSLDSKELQSHLFDNLNQVVLQFLGIDMIKYLNREIAFDAKETLKLYMTIGNNSEENQYVNDLFSQVKHHQSKIINVLNEHLPNNYNRLTNEEKEWQWENMTKNPLTKKQIDFVQDTLQTLVAEVFDFSFKATDSFSKYSISDTMVKEFITDESLFTSKGTLVPLEPSEYTVI